MGSESGIFTSPDLGVLVDGKTAHRLHAAMSGRDRRHVNQPRIIPHPVAEDDLVILRHRHSQQVEPQKALARLIGAGVKSQAGHVRKDGRDERDLPIVQPSVQRRNLIRVGVDRLGDHVVFAMGGRSDRQGPRGLHRKDTGPREEGRGNAARFQYGPSRDCLSFSCVPTALGEEDRQIGPPAPRLPSWVAVLPPRACEGRHGSATEGAE